MITDINSEDRLVQRTFTEHLRDVLGADCWDMRENGRPAPLLRRLAGFGEVRRVQGHSRCIQLMPLERESGG